MLAAHDVRTRASRLRTLTRIAHLDVLGVDASAAHQWARLRVALRDAGRRVNVNDLWIASIALAHGLPVVTQDDDFEPLAALGELQVVRV